MDLFSRLETIPLYSAIAGALFLVLLAFFFYVLMIFNNLVRLRIMISKAWANVDVLLKQRHDEVPNLVAVIEGVKDFEKSVMTQVAEARAATQRAAGPTAQGEAEKTLTGALGNLFAVAENYPTLKAQENFLMLQKRLSELEDAIADRRTFYNESVAAYNARIREFPDVLLANTFKFLPQEMFQAGAGEKEPVKVGLLR
ncbi:MAG TPA: LemA family protein [bacterium]|nr:LemA family protein [bacterium]